MIGSANNLSDCVVWVELQAIKLEVLEMFDLENNDELYKKFVLR